MGRSKNVLTLLVLLLIISSSLVSARSDPTMVHRASHARKMHGHHGWQKKTWMNHGSFREQKKHLMKPSSNRITWSSTNQLIHRHDV
ncbi:hypothetical protein vseg_006075 [Gypsophila vaccaria]